MNKSYKDSLQEDINEHRSHLRRLQEERDTLARAIRYTVYQIMQARKRLGE